MKPNMRPNSLTDLPPKVESGNSDPQTIRKQVQHSETGTPLESHLHYQINSHPSINNTTRDAIRILHNITTGVRRDPFRGRREMKAIMQAASPKVYQYNVKHLVHKRRSIDATFPLTTHTYARSVFILLPTHIELEHQL